MPAGDSVDDDLRNQVWRGNLVDHSAANLLLHVPYRRELETQAELAVLPCSPTARRASSSPAIRRRPRASSLAGLAGQRIGVELACPISTWDRPWAGRSPAASSISAARRTGSTPCAAARSRRSWACAARSRPDWARTAQRFDLGGIPLTGAAAVTWPIGAAVRENARDLGYAAGDIIAAAVRDGAMATIFARHGVGYHPPPFAWTRQPHGLRLRSGLSAAARSDLLQRHPLGRASMTYLRRLAGLAFAMATASMYRRWPSPTPTCSRTTRPPTTC
ncbi:MAG: hypothetical protein U1E52_03625 [Geminicoccaceae bacterium]